MQRKPILLSLPFVYIVCLAVFIAALALAGPAQALAQVKIIVHYVEGVFAPEKNGYRVQVYLSVLDGTGKPVKDLSPTNFTLTEDSRKYAIDSVSVATQPMNVVLLMDNSLSMGAAMNGAKQSAEDFISGLQDGDRAAVVSFNEQIHREIEFSGDFDQVRKAVQQIQVSTSASGTCLYDAAYEAVQLAATEPSGRRAVILLTDGVDEIVSSNKGCSTHTIDDVIGVASKGTTRIPIYTIGLGSRTDERGLARIAEMTGGDYLKSSDASRLGKLFTGLSEAIKSQYVLAYTSSGAPGPHNVVVEVNYQNAKDLDMRDYTLPPMPSSLTILSPVNGQRVEGELNIQADVSTQGKIIAQVVFMLDGEEAGWDNTYPYALELETVKPGKHTLDVAAIGQDNSEVARSSIQFESVAVAEPTAQPTTAANTGVAAPTVVSSESKAAATDSIPNLALLIGGGVGLLLVVIIVLAVVLVVRRKPSTSQPGWVGPDGGQANHMSTSPAPVVPDVLATLSVLQSDDPMMVNQVLNITHTTTQLGRGAQNDIIFPRDTPVSRQHAVIEQRGYQFWLSEVCVADSTGVPRKPKYGTFVNDQPLQDASVLLRNGAVIRLGPRVRLEFHLPLRPGEEPTMDGEGATMDGLAGQGARSDPADADRTLSNV